MEIAYLSHENIDKGKWDRCIENAPNGLIYAYSYYLDIMSNNWAALILNDYEAVMPLTWNKKFGITYLHQPPFTQQSGIFGNLTFEDQLTRAFINKALEQFPFMEINLNYANEYKNATEIKCNLILYLQKPFHELEKSFRKDLVKKVKNNQLIYTTSDEVEKAIELFRTNYSERINTPKNSFENLLQLYKLLKNKGQLFIRKVSSPEGKLHAIAIFLKDSRRIYYIMSTTLPEGRESEANYFLLYNVIKEFSEQNLIFDFEGSQIPSIHFFFRKFGAVGQPYPFIRINNLPAWKKWIKNKHDEYKSRN